ncbi:MAG TPA: GTP 3',8-cyclase MoaA [Candidatus Dormibacteraeota bacterium]|jgi:cyclic pyranopterin phosphate synthase|nr:GTP 3',8-cyclase MoaA [Candidatus Dormibacteraeota bacterium]
MGPTTALRDSFGRIADDLRISVTDRCNLRCVYCMPAEGNHWLPRQDVLRFEEITRLARLFVERYGVRTIRLTGGEPLVRSGIEDLVGMLSQLAPDLDLTMTTNGIGLAAKAVKLRAAGLRRVNISLDSLHSERFAQISRRDALTKVMDGIRAAQEAGLAPIKINMVVMRGSNDGEILDFARLAREQALEVRFIEFMPLDGEGGWRADAVVKSQRLKESIEDQFPLVAHPSTGPDPARTYRFADNAPGGVGFISSVSEPFCGSCNRLRLSAEGGLRTCLFSLTETPLRDLMRGGSSDAALASVIEKAVWAKEEGGALKILSPDYVKPVKNMSQIGG